MIVAGGCYFELCEHPNWRALRGSGGRAAMALAGLSPGVALKTYYPPRRLSDLTSIETSGIEIVASASQTPIAFAYFHALSDPVMAPQSVEIAPNAPIHASGEAVLRFGLIEGTAVVSANRAVYDPQSARGFEPFDQNGSRASELAIVLNERELCGLGNSANLEEAARVSIAQGNASILIAKGGIRGATLFVDKEPPIRIPAYRSNRVFKIGTGDVFSAAFAHYWGERQLDPYSSAILASRSVATYSETRNLPLPPPEGLGDLTPVDSQSFRPVCVVGSPRALGARWLLEEARWRLQQLGLEAAAPSLDGAEPQQVDIAKYGSVLALMDHLDDVANQLLDRARRAGVRIVWFRQLEASTVSDAYIDESCTEDFTTALYWAGWAAAQQ
ncbi:hypothetical protein [Bradyrhizobium sp. AS23.2]|uniref:hypothetical protein n=1 Tax=Bradyrhizobium sp. AS23.2 TaxID=1680155 RepID=UPI00093F56C7|nr:hypothetical protein [Bradyrhizobium sp. AS23.2]